MLKIEKNNPTVRLNYASNGVGFATRYPIALGKVITSLTTQNTTPTLTQLLGGIISHASVTGAGTATLPTGTVLSGINPAVGDSFECLYANTGGQTVTITGSTGSTVVGTAAIATGLNAQLTFVNTGTNTWNVYVIVSA
jgi:hypothetical protein